MFDLFPKFFLNRRVAVDFFAILFGIGAWVGVNGMYIQLPLLVKYAPEGWNLPSFMSIIVQVANIGPIFYAICRKLFKDRLNDAYWIYCILFLGILSPLLMAFFYKHETIINEEPRSLVFLILVFFTALIGCTSSVLFFPYMRHYKEVYLISYLIGEGLSGFVPSILALIQGVGGNPECIENPDSLRNNAIPIYKEPLFSSQIFFILISIIMILSLVGFICLNILEVSKNERISINNNNDDEIKSKDSSTEEIKNVDSDNISKVHDQGNKLTRLRSMNLLLLMSVVCAFGNGVFPSIQSYSCLPYGNTAYHLAVTLSSMANPLACFLAVFLPHTSNKAISTLTSICAVFTGYILATSVLSPTPPLFDDTWGVVLVVISWIFAVGLISYIKLCISTIFRSIGGSWMFFCGSAAQFGSAVGSLISFFLVNYTNIFVQSDPCQ